MSAKYAPTKDNTHLKDLILQWKADPTGNHQELMCVLDKIIVTALGKSGKVGWDRGFEDPEDLLPTYRAFCVPLLHRINPAASNKEMYKYIHNSVFWYNKNRKKASVKKNLQETDTYVCAKKQLLLKNTVQIWDDVVYFEDKDMNQLSELLIQGYSLAQARTMLNWAAEKTEETVGKIRKFYEELGYGSK